MHSPAIRLAVVLSHPTQYYSPWFRWMVENAGVTLHVFYLWDFGVTARRDPQFERNIQWDIDLLSGYESEFVPNAARDPGTHHFRGLDNPSLGTALASWRPSALLLFGYNWKTHLQALWWARRHRIPVILRGDSHFLGRGKPSRLRGFMQRLLFRQFAAFTFVGEANHDYYRTLGVPDRKLFFAPHCVDAERFKPTADATQAAAALRSRLGVDGKRIVLFAGKFQSRKQPVELLRAFHAVADSDHALVFVGDGPLLGELQSFAARRPDRLVRFLPFANQSEMPVRYLLADIFALPSRGHSETWGLAVNEAMHLGVPCLVSEVVGCQRDLVSAGETGWVFTAGDREKMEFTLRQALCAPASEITRLGRNAQQRAGAYTYAQATAGLVEALHSVH